MARILTYLFYFAELGWSRCGALGQLSPPALSLLLLDQVGPWPMGHGSLPVNSPAAVGMGCPVPLLASLCRVAALLCPQVLPKAPPDLSRPAPSTPCPPGSPFPQAAVPAASHCPSTFTPFPAPSVPSFRTRQGFIQMGNEGARPPATSTDSQHYTLPNKVCSFSP